MRFLLDENVDVRLLDVLRGEGHDATSILRDHGSGLADIAVLEIARGEDRILVTNDRDFGEIIFRYGLVHSGMILLRLQSVSFEHKRERLLTTIEQYSGELDRFLVVTDWGVRFRR